MRLHYIWLDVWKTLQKERGMRSLWITGHSLGGALAVLATAKLRFEKAQPVSGLYTYGQPRVGDFEFCSRFDQGFGDYTFRFVNFQDIVPRVPLRNMNYTTWASSFISVKRSMTRQRPGARSCSTISATPSRKS